MRLKNRKKSAAAIKSMKVGTDELKDLIKGAVKEAMGEEDDTGDDGSDTAAALDGITAEDMADIIEQAVDNANEKRKSRKDAGEEVGDLTADEVIQEAAEIIDSMTADEGMDDDEADPEGKDDDEADSDEKDDDEAASEDDAKRRKSAAFRCQVKSGTAPAQRKYSSLFMGGTASAKKQQKSVPPLVNLARAIKCLDVFGRHDPERAEFYAKKYYEDLQYIDSGSYTLNAQKVYTNGHTLQVGAQFRDGFDGQIYTVKQELTHGPVHSMKRYMVEKKGESNPK